MSIERHQASGLFPPLPLPSFDETAQHTSALSARAKPENSLSEKPTEPKLPTAAELEAVWESARQEGYAAGYLAGKEEGFAAGHAEGFAQGYAEGKGSGEKDGYEAGLAQGREAGLTAGQEAARAEWEPRWREQLATLSELVDTLEREYRALPQRLAEPVATLAIEIARSVLGHELTTHPETVVAMAKQALHEVSDRPVTLRASPEDVALLQQALGTPTAVEIVADPHLDRGSVVIEGSHALLDASLASRWRRIVSRFAPQAGVWRIEDETTTSAG